MKICFVGIHNKPGKEPLDSTTKSGQIIDQIIKQCPDGIEFSRVNLFNTDYLPKGEERERLSDKFVCEVVQSDTIYIGLGVVVADRLSVDLQNGFYSIYHPGYILRKGCTETFVSEVSKFITKLYEDN